MRSPDPPQQKMFFYISAEKRIPKGHPPRPVKAMVEEQFLWEIGAGLPACSFCLVRHVSGPVT
jgi:hypothetical protein